MAAIPANNPIADIRRNGMPTPAWLQWFTALVADISGGGGGGATDTEARQLATGAEAEVGQLRARVAMLEKRVEDLARQVRL